jgi:hypothetical protein
LQRAQAIGMRAVEREIAGKGGARCGWKNRLAQAVVAIECADGDFSCRKHKIL